MHLCVCQVQSSLLRGGGWGVCVCVGGGQSRSVRVCLERLSCFRRAIEGRRCYCSGGPEGPGMRAVHPGWPALEAAVGRKDAIFSLAFPFHFIFSPNSYS